MNFGLMTLLGLFIISLPTSNAGANQMSKHYHGTLNLVIGDSDCLIAATDSRATINEISNGSVLATKFEDKHQKLFVVADNIVVTIAGYGNAEVPAAPEFTAPAAAIILDYAEQLRNGNRIPTYNEVVHTLEFLLTFNLTSVANINAWSSGQIDARNYEFHMIIAGKINGQYVITKVILSMKLNGNNKDGYYVNSFASTYRQKIVSGFTYETAGLDDVAIKMLNDIVKINKAMSCDAIKSTIESIMEKTNKSHEGVGGPIQLAIFSKDNLSILSPKFERPIGPRIKHSLFVGGGFTDVKQAVVADSPFLFIATTFNNAGVILDKNYFFGSNFDNCNIYVSSDAFYLHQSNKMINCKLFIGSKVNLKSHNLKNILRYFKRDDIFLESTKR